MTKEGNTEQSGTDTALNELIAEEKVPERAVELEGVASDWLDNNAQYFDLFDWSGMKEKYWKKKAFNEAGLYLRNAFNYGEDDHTPALQELIKERVNDQRFAQLLLRNQNDFHHFAYSVLYAAHADALTSEIAETFERVAEQGEFWSTERHPYRLLEFCYLSRVMGIPCEHDPADIIKYSVMYHQPNIVKTDYLDTYCLTHDVMFYNNDDLFYNNYRDVDNSNLMSTTGPYECTNVLRGLILRYMAEDNCDLVLELLLSGILQRQISREMVRLVLSWILEKTRRIGYVPGPDKGSMIALVSPKLIGSELDAPWEYDYESDQEGIWAKNYHTNVVAGMTARVIKSKWNELENRPMDHSLEEYSFRQDVMRLGQLLKSLAEYDLWKGSQRMVALSDSPVITEFPFVFNEAVSFLEDQQTREGEFGYWIEEEIIYTNRGNSRESFQNELAKPVSEACRTALDAVETSSQT